MEIRLQDYSNVGLAMSLPELQNQLVRMAERMEFGLVSAVLMKGRMTLLTSSYARSPTHRQHFRNLEISIRHALTHCCIA